MQSTEQAAHRGGMDAPGTPEGKHAFSFTYDDTGETVTVVAPNGWTVQRVVEEAYGELGETAQADDRIEFGGNFLTNEQRAMHVKEFVERGFAPDGKFHIVSKPGGASL